MIKNYYIILAFLTLSLVGFGRDFTVIPPDSSVSLVNRTAATYLIEEGKTLYFEGKVKDAILKFRQAGVKDPLSWKASYWISRCHYEMDNYGYALKYAQEAVLLNDNVIDNDVYDLLATSYHRLGILDTAIVHYELAIEKLPKLRSNELKLPLKLEQAKFAQEQLKSGNTSKRSRLTGNVNSGYNDYSPVILEDGNTMYFTSRRSNTKGGNINPSDQQFFEDIYIAKWNKELNEWDSVSNNLDKLNSTGFESISWISPDGMIGYITLNTDQAPEEKTRTRSSDIFEIDWTKQGRWSKPKAIKNKSINTSFFDGSPTLTADGNTMYFVSEKNAVKSESDIFVVEKVGKKWGTAKALPSSINSKGRETTPFITPDGRYLFFSSNGLVGMGDYDIFVVENTGNGWGEPKNLGSKINTVNNDTHFKFYAQLGKVYISGLEVVGDKASIDIYEINTSLEELLK